MLKSERGKKMAHLLGIKGDITREESCISCHGVLVKNTPTDETFTLEEGVSCLACHGAFGEWYDPHKNPKQRAKWRLLSRKIKDTQYGMTDLWDPATRAAVCASCHIGNTAEGKVVTHAMYAAGHPPLPGLETATFSDAMPRHWKYLSEKKNKEYLDKKTAAVQKVILEHYHLAKNDLERSQLVVIAGVVSFRESMNLLATQAEQGPARDTEKQWPELAQFDCYACHHDLKTPSTRQARATRGNRDGL